MHTNELPDHVARPAAEKFLAAIDGHKLDVGQSQVDDLRAVLAGELAPSRRKKPRRWRGEWIMPVNLTLTEALHQCMGYVIARDDPAVEPARKELTKLQYWRDPNEPAPVDPGWGPKGPPALPWQEYKKPDDRH